MINSNTELLPPTPAPSAANTAAISRDPEAQERVSTGEPIGVCQPVQLEFGTPPDIALLGDPDNKVFVSETSQNLEAAHAYGGRDFETGVAARRAVKMLGCGACDLAKVNVCTVKDDLDSRAEMAEVNADAYKMLDMITSAPAWLKAARINQTGETADALQEQVKDIDAAKQFIASGNLTDFLSETTNSFEGLFTKKDLPELANLSVIDDKAEMPATKLHTKNGDTFTVVDATQAVGFTDTPPDDLAYGVLMGKLLNRMRERDPQGRPQIMTADPNNTMQKSITRMNAGANMFEIRMTGKNRAYVVVQPNTDAGEIARITIMGSHGGDAQTQSDFIARIV